MKEHGFAGQCPRLWRLLALTVLCLLLGGAVRASAAEEGPHTRADGGKYCLAYVDYDEYLPASRQFYYILKGLEERGWIEEGSIPFDIERIDRENLSTRQLYEALEEADLGPYLTFLPGAFHYLAYEDREAAAQDLISREGDLDLILTFGTNAGLFVKSLGLSIPMMDYSATDPVASGIIDSSAGGSGNPYVWAHVEPALPLRQIRYYYSVRPFRKLGVIYYGDENISGIPSVEESAREIGFDLVKSFIPEQERETEEELARYYELVEEKILQMCEEDIDALYLPVDVINDTDRLYPLLSHFYEKNIPTFLMDDVSYVENGALMLICANDMENIGRFVADAMAQVFGGAQAGDLPCVYTSAPSIYVNLDVAKRIGYKLNFGFLAVCDQIFTEGEPVA